MSCSDQSQHAARTEQDGMASLRTRQDRSSDELPTWPPHRAALLDAGYSKGVQEDIAASFELRAASHPTSECRKSLLGARSSKPAAISVATTPRSCALIKSND